MNYLFSLVLAVGFPVLGLQAQKVSDTLWIQGVEVFGQKPLEEVGLNRTTIDTLVMQSIRCQTLSELISAHTPVFIKTYGRGSTASASFRGTAASHTQVLWNGINVNSPMRGDVDFSLFPVYFVDRVALLHGGSSLSEGSGALGGSVLIDNQADWDNRMNLKYIQAIESFGTYKEYLQLGFGNRSLQIRTRFFHEQSENNFSYYNYGQLPQQEDVQKNANYYKYGMMQELYANKGQNSLSLKLWGHYSNRQLPQLMSWEGAYRKEYQIDENLRGVFNWKYFGQSTRWEYNSGFNFMKLNYFRSSTQSGYVNFDSRSKEKSWFNKLTFSFKNGEVLHFKSVVEANLHQVDIFDHAKKVGYDEGRMEYSLMNHLNARISRRLQGYLLMRTEFYDAQLVGCIPSVGVEYTPQERLPLMVHANLSRNYHKPTLNDLYWLPGGNSELKPEDGYTAETGWHFKVQKQRFALGLDLTGYLSLIDNWIVWHPAENGAYYWEADNIRKVFARGVEIAFKFNGQWGEKGHYKLVGNYAYTRTTNQHAVESVDDSRGKQLIYIPKHTAGLAATIDYQASYFNLSQPLTGKRYTVSSNKVSDFERNLNTYTLTDVQLGHKFSWYKVQADLSFQVENLFDIDYQAILWRPMPGRTYSLRLQIGWRK